MVPTALFRFVSFRLYYRSGHRFFSVQLIDECTSRRLHPLSSWAGLYFSRWFCSFWEVTQEVIFSRKAWRDVRHDPPPILPLSVSP